MSRKVLSFIAVAATVLVVDQVTKFLVLDRLTEAFDGKSALATFWAPAPAPGFDGYHYRAKAPVVLSGDFFQLRYAENPGAAFGLFRTVPEQYRGPLFHVISLGAVLLIAWYVTKLTGAKNEVWAKWGLPLVFGGAIGNYVDRLARSFVVDFLEAHWFEKAYWPAFNVADTAIVIGVGLLVVDSFVRKDVAAPAPAKQRVTA